MKRKKTKEAIKFSLTSYLLLIFLISKKSDCTKKMLSILPTLKIIYQD